MTKPEIAPEIRKKQRLMIGPWVHSMGNRKVGELDFGEAADLDDSELMMRWFDSQLKGIDNGISDEPPVKIFVMGENIWRFENEWPLARTKYQKYYFHSDGNANSIHGDGRLDIKPPAEEKPDSYIYDPANPVRTIGGMGPYDQQSVENRADVLVIHNSSSKGGY